MPTKRASTFLTGGGGFGFEDAVAAYYLVMMLGERIPLGNQLGAPTKTMWQASESEWDLDDLVICGQSNYEAGISIKSSAHLKTTGFSKDFVERCWRQFRGESGRQFDLDGDLLCLAVGTIASDVNRAWQLLSGQIQTTSQNRLAMRLSSRKGDGSQASQVQRNIVKSLIGHAPGAKPSVPEALALLKCVRVLHFDFLGDPSQMEDAAIQSCQFLVEGGDRHDAEELWKSLLVIAKQYRQTGGDLAYDNLTQQVAEDHRLATLPNYSQHLRRWNGLSLERLRHATGKVSDTLPPLERSRLWIAWHGAISNGKPLVLAGNSGAGKTSLVNEHAARSGRNLYLIDKALVCSGGVLQGGELSGTPYSLRELLSAERTPSILSVDAVENLSDDDLDWVCALLKAVSHRVIEGQLEIAVSCQITALPRVRTALAREQITCEFLGAPNPSAEEIGRWLGSNSQLVKLAEHEGVLGLFTNLKVLELACRAASSGIAVADQGQLKPTGLLDFLWSEWVEGHGQKLVRSRLLQRLAIQDGESLAAGHAVRELEPGELEHLPSLVNDGLLLKFEESVFFAHDFVADLGRLRALLSSDAEEIVACAKNFRWHNAVRLFAQHVVENSSQRWLQVFNEGCGSASAPSLALFVDGLIIAAETQTEILWEVWPELTDYGHRLLVERLAIAGTRLDERWHQHVSPAISSEAGPWRQCTSRSLSVGLQLLVDLENIDPLLVPSVITLCEMVLRREFIVGDVPEQTTKDAARLTLRMAEELVHCPDRRSKYRETGEDVFRTMLVAALDEPDKVADLALYAAQRRSLPEDGQSAAHDAIEASDVQLPGLPDFLFDDEDADPWPEGPLKRVDETFRTVCIESDALIPLIEARPAVAKEVLLACCIEGPESRGRRSFSSEDKIGVIERYSNRSPLYDVGPFLSFFREASDEAVDIMVHLCNFATDEWYASPARQRLEEHDGYWGARLGPFSVVVPAVDGNHTAWQGSANIYRWSLGGLPHCKIITTILMAFEYWIYERMDDGKDVGDVLTRVMSEGRSVGLAGCLMDVGKKYPQLFLGPLMPLLGCWVFYGWDRMVQLERSSVSEGLMGWGLRESSARREKAVEWHKAEHRTYDILQIARYLFVASAGFRKFLESCRVRWQADIDNTATSNHQLRQLACVFDWANYSRRETDDGQTEVVFRPPQSVVKQGTRELERANVNQLLLSFPFQCQKWMEDGESLTGEQVNWIQSAVELIQDASQDPKDAKHGFPDDTPCRKADGLAGAAAVMLCQARELLDQEGLTFCRNVFESLLRREPPRRPFDDAEAVGSRSWDYFLADLTIEYLGECPTDEAARWGVQRCLMSFHYGAMNHFMKLAYRERCRIPELFPLLPGYIVAWSSLREQLRRLHEELSRHEHWHATRPASESRSSEETSTLETLQSNAEHLDQRFQSLAKQLATWQPLNKSLHAEAETSIAYLTRVSEDAGTTLFYRPRTSNDEFVEHADVGLDLFVLEHGFDWIDLAESANDAEFEDYLALLKDLMIIQRRLLPDLSGNQKFASYGYANKYDSFVNRIVARNIVGSLGKDVSSLWQMKLSDMSKFPGEAEAFLSVFAAMVHDDTPEPGAFVATWAAMLHYAVESDEWTPESGAPPCIWTELLGIDFGGSVGFGMTVPPVDEGWAGRVGRELRSHERLVATAFEVALRNPACTKSLVRAGCQVMWRELRLTLLKTFATPVCSIGDAIYPADSVSLFLNVSWEESSERIASSRDLEAAFRLLLTKAIHCGSKSAQRLADSIGRKTS